MKKTLFVLSLLAFILGAQAALTPGGWNPVVRERLDALVERNRGNPDAYAVFDFDYTTAMGDLSYVCMWHILERFAFQTDDYRAMFTVGVPPVLATEANALADSAEKLKPLAGTDLSGNSEWRAFVRRYWRLYRNLVKEIGEYKAYLWRVRLFAGYTPEGLRMLAREAIAQALASGVGLRRDANAPTEKRGLVITPEIKNLFGELRKAGIAVYIVSGSFTEVLKVATAPDFGLGLPPGNVFGCSLKRDASGRYIPEMADGGVQYGRKPEFIRAHIAPRHHGAEPVLTAGDSMGDYAMLTEFKDLQLALVMRRNWNKPPMRELVERGGRVVAQGRDEVRGCFIPTPESIEPKLETVQSPRPPENSGGAKTAEAAGETRELLVTGYCNCGKCCGWRKKWFLFGAPVYSYGKMKGSPKKVGVTASGMVAAQGTIAADLAAYPLGTRMEIPGYGPGIVQDAGGSVKGDHIDIWFPSHEKAEAWGARKIKVKVAKAGKMPVRAILDGAAVTPR